MNTTSKKRIAVLLCLTMLFALASCNGGTATTSPSTAASGEAKTSASKEPVTIVFQTWNPNETSFQPALDAWNALGTNITIKLLSVEYADHIQTLKVNMAAGEGPDIFGVQDGSLMKQFNEFTLDISSKAAAEWGADWYTKKFNSLYMSRIKGSLGSYFGVPIGGTSAGYMYANSTICDKYGIKIPKTFDDLVAACKTLRAAGSYPFLFSANADWMNLDFFMSIAGDINQEKLYSAFDGKTAWTDSDLVKAFSIWQSCFTNGVFPDGAIGGVDTGKYFFTDTNAALEWDGSWFYTYAATSKTMAAAMDKGSVFSGFTLDWNGDGKAAPVTTGPDVVVCINKNSKHIDEAWKAVSFLTTNGVKAMIDKNLSYIPATVDYTLPTANFNAQAVSIFNFVLKKCNDGTAGYREIPYPDLKTALAQQLQALGIGSVTPEKAAAAVEAASQAQKR